MDYDNSFCIVDMLGKDCLKKNANKMSQKKNPKTIQKRIFLLCSTIYVKISVLHLLDTHVHT